MTIGVLVHRRVWPKMLNLSECKSLFDFYRYAVWYKSNPKNLVLTLEFLRNYFPALEGVDLNFDDKRSIELVLSLGEDIVFLYQDSIGLGYLFSEIKFIHKILLTKNVYAINGRGRKIPINLSTYPGILIRRFFEWTMLPEIIFSLLFILVTPFFFASDVIRGKM